MYDTNEIYHHGVSGMKWGKRNGPPYPLNAAGKASLAKQKKASAKTSSGDTTEYGSILSKKKKKQKEADYSKMSDEEKAQAKQKAIREGNIREANANRNEYTDQELKAVKERFQLNSDVAKLSKATVKTGQQKADEIASKFETAARLTNAVANTSQNSVRIYNTLGAIAAKLNGTKFEPIGTGGGKNKNKAKDNTKMKGLPERQSLTSKIINAVADMSARKALGIKNPIEKSNTKVTNAVKSSKSRVDIAKGTNNQKALESSGYKVDNDNLGGDFMTKKKSGVNVHIGISDNMLFDDDYITAAKQLEKHVPKLTSEVDAMAKKDSFIQEHNIKAIPNSHYVVIDGPEFGETGFFGDDGHEYSVYFDPKTGEILDKQLAMNG